MIRALLGCLLLCGAAGGCASAVASGSSAALAGDDLVRITDDMAMKLAGDAEVRDAIAREGPLPVVVQPVVNNLQAEVIPRGQAEAFTARLRVLLAQQAPGDFVWVMNRDAWRRLRARELDPSALGPDPDSLRPRYALTATFSSLTDEDRRRRTAYYLCRFELSGLDERTTLWTDAYELQKTAVRGFLD